MNTLRRRQNLDTPWGPAVWQYDLGPGVWLVQTYRHGGVMLYREKANDLLSPKAQRIGRVWGRYLAFEEDCEIAAFMYEQPELFLRRAKDRGPKAVAETKADAEEELRRWWPEYFLGT